MNKTPPPPRRSVNISLPAEAFEHFATTASKEGRAVSAVICRALCAGIVTPPPSKQPPMGRRGSGQRRVVFHTSLPADHADHVAQVAHARGVSASLVLAEIIEESLS